MYILKEDLKKLVIQTPNRELWRRNFFIQGKKKQDIKLINGNIADVISVAIDDVGGLVEKHLVFRVFKFEEEKITIDSLTVLMSNIRSLTDYLWDRSIEQFTVYGVLVGPTLFDNEILDFAWCIDSDNANIGGISHLQIYTYNYKIDGIQFKKLF